MFTKEAVYVALASVLFYQWKESEKRYISDIPFLLGLAFIGQSVQHVFDILWVTGLVPYATIASQIMIFVQFIIISTVLILLFITMLDIWFENKPKIRNIGILLYCSIVIGLFTIIILIDYELVVITMFLLGIPTFALLAITFIFAYHQQRLSNIHPLFVGMGAVVAMSSYFVHAICSKIGTIYVDIYTSFSFIGVLVEIIGYSLFLYGFLKKAPY